jgi:hypothetical protein
VGEAIFQQDQRVSNSNFIWATVIIEHAILVARFAVGGSVIKYRSPLNVLKGTYDYSCCLARSCIYNLLMTDPPRG